MFYSSVQNNKIKELGKLNTKKYRDKTGLFLVEGEHLIVEAYNSGYLKEVLLLEGNSISLDVKVNYVSESVMKFLSSLDTPTNMIGVCHKKENEIKGDKLLVLDDVQDPGNLGTIIRSAVAFNIDTIILSPDTVDLYNEKVIRASEGMIFNLNFVKKDLKLAIEDLKKDNYQIIGTNVQKGELLKNISFSAKTGIIMGNEGRGMNQSLLDYCDNLAYIPISNSCESLNVAIAASIIFYEINR